MSVDKRIHDPSHDIDRIVQALTTDDVSPGRIRLISAALEFMTAGEMRSACIAAGIKGKFLPSEAAVRGVLRDRLERRLKRA